MDYHSIITRSESVFIDTAPIIYFIEAHETYGPLVKHLMEIISKGTAQLRANYSSLQAFDAISLQPR